MTTEDYIVTEDQLAGLASTNYNDYDDELVNDGDIDALEGELGWRFPHRNLFKRAFSRRLHHAVKRKYYRATKRAVMPVSVKRLAVASKQFPTSTIAEIKRGNVKSGDAIHYIRKEITGKNGIIEIFDDTIDKVAGITDISKGKLGEHMNLLLNRMTMKEGEGNNVKDAEYMPMTYGNTPAGLINGEVSLMVGGKTLFTLPVNAFMNPAKKYAGNGPADGYDFDVPQLIKENENIQIKLNLVAAIPTTEKHFLEIGFVGVETKPVR